MAYIGRNIDNLSDRVKLDAITTSATATYNLLLSSAAYTPSSAESLTVSLNGVIQAPQTSYSVSGSTIIFASALTSSDTIDFILAERAIQLTTVGSGTVGSSQITADVITGQTALAATPADTDELLISDAGTLKRIDYSYIKASNTPSFSAYAPSGSSQSISTGSETKVNFSTELFDTDSKYDNSAMRFTPGIAGKYLITAGLSFGTTGDGNYVIIFIYKNGSALWKNINRSPGSADNGVAIAGLVELDDDDYVEIFCKQNTGSNQTITGGNSDRTTFFGGFKLA